MIEISGRENKIEAFIDRMRRYGIAELVRTGRIAMVAGNVTGKRPDGRPPVARQLDPEICNIAAATVVFAGSPFDDK